MVATQKVSSSRTTKGTRSTTTKKKSKTTGTRRSKSSLPGTLTANEKLKNLKAKALELKKAKTKRLHSLRNRLRSLRKTTRTRSYRRISYYGTNIYEYEPQVRVIKLGHRAVQLAFPYMQFCVINGSLKVTFSQEPLILNHKLNIQKTKTYLPPLPNTDASGRVCLGYTPRQIGTAIAAFWNKRFDPWYDIHTQWCDLYSYANWARQTEKDPNFIMNTKFFTKTNWYRTVDDDNDDF